MATLLSDLIYEVRQHLYTGRREGRNRLAANVTDTATTWTFDFDLEAIRPGAKLSIDLEDVHVWSVDAANKTATVERGMWGTTAAAHTDGDIVVVNPRFSDYDILRAVNAELGSLSAEGLFQVKTEDLTYSASVRGYDLGTIESDFIDVYEVRARHSGPELDWPVIQSWSLIRDASTSDFSSGFALVLHRGGDPGQTIRVQYKAAYDTLSALTDNVATASGLHVQAHDILALGAGLRLATGREIARNFDESQGDTRRAEEVPPGSQLNAIRGLAILREQRIEIERARLLAKYPPRLR